MKTADDFQHAAARARRIRPILANQLDQEAVSQVISGWNELHHRRRLICRVEFFTADQERIIIQRWLLPRADGLFQMADLPE